MADRLDVVPVGIQHERAVVVGVVLRAQAGLAVAASAVREGGRVELPDGRARRRAERDVESGRRSHLRLPRGILEADVEGETFAGRIPGRSVRDLAGDLLVRDETERCERSVVERLRAGEVVHAE